MTFCSSTAIFASSYYRRAALSRISWSFAALASVDIWRCCIA